MKKPMKSGLRKMAALTAALAVIASSSAFSAFADENRAGSIDEFIQSLATGTETKSRGYVVEDPDIEKVDFPSSYDMRDINGVSYVPEIRSQSPFGSCWSFGSTAAAEISLSAEMGWDYNKMTQEEKDAVELSEKHLAWFAFEPIHENDPLYPSQAGEGKYPIYTSDDLTFDEQVKQRYNLGGLFDITVPMYASGVGPCFEQILPYENTEHKFQATLSTFNLDKNMKKTNEVVILDKDDVTYEAFQKEVEKVAKSAKNIETDGFTGAGKYYAARYAQSDTEGWGVDYSYKYTTGLQVDNASMLPTPAEEGPNGEYIYNPQATDAIKRELIDGRAVAIAFLADTSKPDEQTTGGKYLILRDADGNETPSNLTNKYACHYTYDPKYDPSDPDSINKKQSMNHAITIIGYDDNFPAEYFNDPNGTLQGNGAWLCRNSWGSTDNSIDWNKKTWGNNGGDGYFWVSYYDQSLNVPQSYDFRTNKDGDLENADGIFNHMYDTMPTSSQEMAFDKGKGIVYTANIFKEEQDVVLSDVGIDTGTPNSSVTFNIYLLNDDYQKPTDGKAIKTVTKKFDYAGFHCVKLDKELVIPAGTSYSIVARTTREDGKNAVNVKCGLSEQGAMAMIEAQRQQYIAEKGTEEGFVRNKQINNYMNAVVNEGESYIGITDKKGVNWTDWKEVSDKAASDGMAVFDNLSIRAYVKGNVMTVNNTVQNEKAAYKAGDVINGSVTIKNEITSSDVYVIKNIELVDSLGAIEPEDAHIESLAPGESKTINYTYTVTEEDAAAGSITSTINVMVNGEPYNFLKELAKNTFTVETALDLTAPTNVKVSKNGKVTWTAAENAEGYRVVKEVNGVTYYGSKVTGTSYTFNKKPAGNYKVSVIAYGKANDTVKSDVLEVKAEKALGFVNDVTVDKDGKIAWEAADNAVAYKVGKVMNGKVYYSAKVTDTSYQLKVVPSTDYQIFVVAFDENGNTAWGKKNTFEVGDLGSVLDTKVDKNGKVTWSAVRGAKYYYVGKTVNGKTSYSGKLTDTNYTINNLPKSDYKLFVVTEDENGKMTWGKRINVKAK